MKDPLIFGTITLDSERKQQELENFMYYLRFVGLGPSPTREKLKMMWPLLSEEIDQHFDNHIKATARKLDELKENETVKHLKKSWFRRGNG